MVKYSSRIDGILIQEFQDGAGRKSAGGMISLSARRKMTSLRGKG